MFQWMSFQKDKYRFSISARVLVFVLSFSLIFGPAAGYAQVVPQAALNLPAPGTFVGVSQPYSPPIIHGFTIDPENIGKFNFIIDRGDELLSGQDLESESAKLIRYFMAALTVPEEQMWVNLSPYEKNRIIADDFSRTEMGRDLLAQDYLLKQLTASLMYPEDEIGKNFWKRVYQRAQSEYGTTDIPMNTFNKIWIIPQAASVYIHDQTVFVADSHLKVMLEEDYLALEHHTAETAGDSQLFDSNVTSEIVREILIPEIEREINEGKTFANLRQIFNAVILAAWYKENLKDSFLGQSFVDQGKVQGIALDDPRVNMEIYDRYVEAFEKGVYNFIKEEKDSETGDAIPRKYFSGGVNFKTEEIPDTGFMDFSRVAERSVVDVEASIAGARRSDEVMLELSFESLVEKFLRFKSVAGKNFGIYRQRTTTAVLAASLTASMATPQWSFAADQMAGLSLERQVSHKDSVYAARMPDTKRKVKSGEAAQIREDYLYQKFTKSKVDVKMVSKPEQVALLIQTIANFPGQNLTERYTNFDQFLVVLGDGRAVVMFDTPINLVEFANYFLSFLKNDSQKEFEAALRRLEQTFIILSKYLASENVTQFLRYSDPVMNRIIPSAASQLNGPSNLAIFFQKFEVAVGGRANIARLFTQAEFEMMQLLEAVTVSSARQRAYTQFLENMAKEYTPDVINQAAEKDPKGFLSFVKEMARHEFLSIQRIEAAFYARFMRDDSKGLTIFEKDMFALQAGVRNLPPDEVGRYIQMMDEVLGAESAKDFFFNQTHAYYMMMELIAVKNIAPKTIIKFREELADNFGKENADNFLHNYALGFMDLVRTLNEEGKSPDFISKAVQAFNKRYKGEKAFGQSFSLSEIFATHPNSIALDIAEFAQTGSRPFNKRWKWFEGFIEDHDELAFLLNDPEGISEGKYQSQIKAAIQDLPTFGKKKRLSGDNPYNLKRDKVLIMYWILVYAAQQPETATDYTKELLAALSRVKFSMPTSGISNARYHVHPTFLDKKPKSVIIGIAGHEQGHNLFLSWTFKGLGENFGDIEIAAMSEHISELLAGRAISESGLSAASYHEYFAALAGRRENERFVYEPAYIAHFQQVQMNAAIDLLGHEPSHFNLGEMALEIIDSNPYIGMEEFNMQLWWEILREPVIGVSIDSTSPLVEDPSKNVNGVIRAKELVDMYRQANQVAVKGGSPMIAANVGESESDQAALSSKMEPLGGIDLNTKNFKLNANGDVIQFEAPFSGDFGYENYDSFIPVIINISPILNLPLLLGLRDVDSHPNDTRSSNVNLSFNGQGLHSEKRKTQTILNEAKEG